MQFISEDIIKKVFPERSPEAHKYDSGFLLVIGGSQFYTGSPALSGMAGFRAGVDMVRILAPKRAADIIAGFSPNLATVCLEGQFLDNQDLPCLLTETQSAVSVANGRAAVVIGGGLGRSQRVKEAVVEYLKTVSDQLEKETPPFVIDADAIHAVAQSLDVLKKIKSVITPHLYELSVISGRNISELNTLSLEQKAQIVKETAKGLGAVILLKGSKDIISDGRHLLINKTGTPFMSVGGTGDTLAGICGALLAKGISPLEAAGAAAFINGRAGELASEKYGAGMLATDLIEIIPEVLKGVGYENPIS